MAKPSNRTVAYLRNGDYLRRSVGLKDGRSYAHSCSVEVFKSVAYAVEESDAPTTLSEIAEKRELPYTQVNVALEFLKERGLVQIARRRSRAASKTFFEDAMCEFYAMPDADRPQE